MPFTAPTASPYRGVGIDALVVQVLVAGSYASTVARSLLVPQPPTAYRMPFTTPTANPHRAVGIDALVVQTPGPPPREKLGAPIVECMGPPASWQAAVSSVAVTPRTGARPIQR